jgi:Uma2 family endonuclease
MSTTLSPPSAAVPVAPRPRVWTRAEYYRLADLGFFRGQRAERIGGVIMVQSPQNWPHARTTDRAAEVLRGAFGPGFWTRMQLPLSLGQSSDPEPDVSVVAGRREDYSDHPPTAALVVEVSDTTLWFDRNEKASLYAAAGVADYWIIDLGHGRLEVRRDPRPDPAQPHGAAYATLTTHAPGETVTPLAAPQARVAVADLLP